MSRRSKETKFRPEKIQANRSEEIRLVLPGFSIDLRDKNLIGLFFPTDFGPFRPTQNGPFCPPLTMDYLLFHEFTHILDDEKFVANVLYDIDLAIFGCAALSCIMAYSEYLVARREAMDEFFKEFLKLGNDLLKFPPIKVDLPLELFQKILSEEWKNEVSYVLGTEKETKAVDEFKQWQLDSLRSNDSIDKK